MLTPPPLFFSAFLVVSLRGSNADVILVDEAAYIPLEMFYEVIVPLIGMENSVLIMISTPVDSFNFFTRLMETRDPDTGYPLFLVVDMELSCKRCKETDPLKCTHRLKYLPPWKSEDKNKLMKLIMADQVTILARENYGIATDEGKSYIPKNAIDRFEIHPRFAPDHGLTCSLVYITIDPNGGGLGPGSDMAIISVALLYGMRVVSRRPQWRCIQRECRAQTRRGRDRRRGRV